MLYFYNFTILLTIFQFDIINLNLQYKYRIFKITTNINIYVIFKILY